MADFWILVARILVAGLFIGSGVGHLTKTAAMTEYATYKKVPAAKAGVVASGVVWLACGAAILLGIGGDLACYVLAAALVPTTILFHDFWTVDDPATKQSEMIGFQKNFALIGGLIGLGLAMTAYTGLSVGSPVFG